MAAEARIIRKEEIKAGKQGKETLRNRLREHRTGSLRDEAFYTHAIYAVARGIPKDKAFPKLSREIDIVRLKDKAKRKGIDHRDVDDWLKKG